MTTLTVENLSKTFIEEKQLFGVPGFSVRALQNVSISIPEGKILGLVGESGSGKSTLAKIVCRYFEPDEGSVSIYGKPLESYSRKELSHTVQMIFQDPYSSLNPRLNIETILNEAVLDFNNKLRLEKITSGLKAVGLESSALRLYPHQFSGGQRQRIAIARALLKEPKLLIADEPLSSLDLTIQSQILDLFLELRNKYNIAILFISHDIATTASLCDYIAVLKGGVLIEYGSTNDIITSPKGEYTKQLLAAVPS
jgi:ABC-type dipeptide/oligopeptide/nickel transport system ATPase subunit